MREHMFPLAVLVTPNLREAEILLGREQVNNPDAMAKAARDLVHMGARAALITGGALEGADAVDILFDGHEIHRFSGPRRGPRAHGAGCTLSAAIAACLACGDSMVDAIGAAKSYVSRAIEQSPPLGHGSRPLNHLVGAIRQVTPRWPVRHSRTVSVRRRRKSGSGNSNIHLCAASATARCQSIAFASISDRIIFSWLSTAACSRLHPPKPGTSRL